MGVRTSRYIWSVSKRSSPGCGPNSRRMMYRYSVSTSATVGGFGMSPVARSPGNLDESLEPPPPPPILDVGLNSSMEPASDTEAS